MLDRDVGVLNQIRIILESDVFTKVNAASQEAAESVIKCINLLQSIEDQQINVDKRTDSTLDFANEHESFVGNFIKQCDDKGLYAFIQLADNKCRNNIIAGTMPSEGIIMNTIQTIVNIPEILEPILIGIGIPSDCVEQCDSMREKIENIRDKTKEIKIEIPENKESHED